jgi:hypothetical protein
MVEVRKDGNAVWTWENNDMNNIDSLDELKPLFPFLHKALAAGVFKNFKNNTFETSIEGYYKSMDEVIPYDIDNVKIRYLGENNAKAYATGIEFRLFGEFTKDAESWLSLGLMKTMLVKL